jgi:hypothetical protein
LYTQENNKENNKENNGRERGIRTPGPFQVNGFQDRRFKPLSHLSNMEQLYQSFYKPQPGI